MVVAKSVKTRALRVVLGAMALAAVVTGVTAGTASAEPGHRGYEHGRDYGRHDYGRHEAWRGAEWRYRHDYRPGYDYRYRYAPPRVVYAPPPVYVAPPSYYQGYPGGLNFGFVIR